jgi:hypothetical protein
MPGVIIALYFWTLFSDPIKKKIKCQVELVSP